VGPGARRRRLADVHARPGVRSQAVQRRRGCYYANDKCWFTTKGDNRVWAYNAATQTLDLAYDDNLTSSPSLTGVDNITGSTGGDLYVAEDRDNLEINIITRPPNGASAGTVAPFLRVTGQNGSELCGPAFSPDGTRLYFSSQRGTTGAVPEESPTRSGVRSGPESLIRPIPVRLAQ